MAILDPGLQPPGSRSPTLACWQSLCLSVPLSYISQAWTFSFSGMAVLLPLCTFPRNAKSPASVSLPSHWLLATLFIIQNQHGVGTLSISQGCSLEAHNASIKLNPQNTDAKYVLSDPLEKRFPNTSKDEIPLRRNQRREGESLHIAS